MKYCTNCKWYDERREDKIKFSSVGAASAVMKECFPPIGYTDGLQMGDHEIKDIQSRYWFSADLVYHQWEEMIKPICAHKDVVNQENGLAFSSITDARMACGYTKPRYWQRKNVDELPHWTVEAREKTFETIKKRIKDSVERKEMEREINVVNDKLIYIRKGSSIFERIMYWFGL
jgi:hypothetical protein